MERSTRQGTEPYGVHPSVPYAQAILRKLPARLIVTHRFPLTSTDDIDDELCEWLNVAYQLDE